MAHSLYTPTQAARSTLAALRYVSVLPRTVRQDFSQEFVAGRGRTVDIKKPVQLSHGARDYTDANRTARDAIVFDEVSEETQPITMDKQVYSAVRLPDDFATFTLTSLESQVLAPQAEAVADAVANPLVDVMKTTPGADTGGGETALPQLDADGSNILDVLIKTRALLNARKVPMAGRTVAMGVGFEAAMLSHSQLQKVNESGTDGLLREATLGRLFGFDFIVAPEFDANFAVAYQRDAFAHVTRPSKAPNGAASTATVSQDGFALRWIQHYNPLQLEDQSVVDTFVGADHLDSRRAVSLTQAAV